MDNITHSLTGLALARAGLNRLSPRATLLLVLSANAPDVDIVALRSGALRYFEVHRGYTHSLLFAPAMAFLAVIVTAAICRRRLPWVNAWLICCVGVFSHLALDWTNSYGTRLLLPWSSRWFHSDLNGLYDVWILTALAFAALWPGFARLVGREIGDRSPVGRVSAVFALSFFLLFDVGKSVLHEGALAQLGARLYDSAVPIKVAALPNSFNPFVWEGVVETTTTYDVLRVRPFGQLEPESGETLYKASDQQAIQAAKATEPFRYFSYFARFPVWSEEPLLMNAGQGKRIEISDLRFGAPGVGSFHCIAFEDSAGRVLEARFTYGSGKDIQWTQ